MKAFILIMASVFGLSLQSIAHGFGYSNINSYADAIVFDEMGVTFSVYPDGEFDFYLGNTLQSSTIGNGFVNVTFNSGFNYNPYVQYDDFGAVIQVENVPIWYDHFGRVAQIGDVLVSYRNRRLFRVGGLRVFYNSRGFYSHHTGFINTWNPYFVYRPFYMAFVRPRPGFCFVRPNPYRQFYRPMRYTYYRPYVNNIRPAYATAGNTYRPRGYGRVHSRYTQQVRRGEIPVRRERRKITTAHASQRPMAINGSRNNSNINNAGYNRNVQSSKPINVRSSASRSAQANRLAVQRSNSRAAQNVSGRSAASARVNASATRTPSSVSSGSKNAYSRSQTVRPNSTRTNSSRGVKPSSSTRTQSVNRASSRGSSSSNQTVRSRTSSRSSATRSRATTKPSSSVNRSSRSTVSKGNNSSSKSGGKVSVGNRSSKRGR